MGACGSKLGALVLPTGRQVNRARFVRHPIRSMVDAVRSRRGPSSTARGRFTRPLSDVPAIERPIDPLTGRDGSPEWEHGGVLPIGRGLGQPVGWCRPTNRAVPHGSRPPGPPAHRRQIGVKAPWGRPQTGYSQDGSAVAARTAPFAVARHIMGAPPPALALCTPGTETTRTEKPITATVNHQLGPNCQHLPGPDTS